MLVEYSTKHITEKNYNTFGINVTAKRFVEIDSLEQLKELLTREKDLSSYSVEVVICY